MTARIFYCLVAIAMSLWSGAASAASQNFNSYEYTFGQSIFSVMPGGTVEVPVYFQETVGSQDISILAPSGSGLVGAGVQVICSDSPQPMQPARITALSDIIANPAFDVPTPSLTAPGAKLALGKLVGPAVKGEEFSDGVYRLLLGTFRFTAGNVPNEFTPIRATDFDTGFSDFVTGSGKVLDASPIPDARATIAVIPEPSSLALFAVTVLVGMAWQMGRKKPSAA
jgi:hypothetical protein